MSKDVTRRGGSPLPVAGREISRKTQDFPNMGPENKTDASKQKPRRQPCCGFCRNHNQEVPVINHQCQYAECICAFCELTRRRRKVMRHQQRLWRYKKFSAGQREGEENNSEGEVTPNSNFPHEEPEDLQRSRRKMVCDKCRNHDRTVEKKGHKGNCPYDECSCDLCNFTIKRQQLMKHQQRVRRNAIINISRAQQSTEHTEKPQPQPLTDADSPDSDLQPLEEVAPTHPPAGTLEKRKEEGTEPKKSPPVSAAPLEMTPTADWTNAVKESAMEDAPRPQDNPFQPVTTTPCQPPPLDPLPDYQVTSDIHSSHMLNKNEHNLNSPPRIECPGNMRLSVRCGCFGPLPQVPAASTTLPSLPMYGLDVGHQRFVPWIGRVSETGERCTVEGNNNVRPQAPLRPQPIPATRLPRPQMDWQLRGFPYSTSSVLQSVPQPSTLFVCDHFRSHHPQAGLDEHWHGTKGPHPTEGNGVHPSYSAGLPYFASALLHPSAKPSLSLMPTSRTLPEYGSPLPGFRHRDQHQVNPLGAFT